MRCTAVADVTPDVEGRPDEPAVVAGAAGRGEPELPLPRKISLITGAALADGTICDVEIGDGLVTDVVTPGTAGVHPPAETLDLEGFVLLPAPAEPHAHLDKARSWAAIQPPYGDLVSAIDSWRSYADGCAVEDFVCRARAQALELLVNGTTAVRSHVDILSGPEPLRAVRALLEVRDELAGLMDIELVALASLSTPDWAIEAALDAGVDLVGGAPHLAPDPAAELARLLTLAERYDRGADLHTDEGLAGPLTVVDYARAVEGWSRPATASHCVRLGTLRGTDLDAAVAAMAAARMGVVTLPITNLYLQGRELPASTPRGLTALRCLLDAGVRVAAGADNVRDPFNPMGRSDALETASLLVTAGHLTVTESYEAVSTGARSVMSLPPAAVTPGGRADLLAVRGSSLVEVVSGAPADRYVLHAGRLVAVTETSRQLGVGLAAPDGMVAGLATPAGVAVGLP